MEARLMPEHERSRSPGGELNSPAEAVELLAARAAPVGVEQAPLSACVGRVLAAPVVADRPSPAVDVSAMDGFAVRAADVSASPLPVRGEARIGVEPGALAAGTAMRIVTGGPIPPGADAVVKVEDVEQRAGGEAMVVSERARLSLKPGTQVRRRGENIGEKQTVCEAGAIITPALVTTLAAFGIEKPVVFRRVRVAVISTGDELVGAGERPTPWQIRDGNGPALAAMIGARAWLSAASHMRVNDDPERLRSAIRGALESCDAVLLSGGVSMGHRDFVPTCLRECGAEILFHKLPQRPGRPMLGAMSKSGQPIMALPGNPVSVLVTARRIAMPVLARMAGFAEGERVQWIPLVPVDTEPIGLWWHRLVRVITDSSSAVAAEALDSRGSGDIVSAARSDGFVEVPPRASGQGPWPFYSWNS
jgi:molybdopterin molybdotransferase